MLGNTVTIVCTPPYLAGGRNFLKLTAAGGRKNLQKAGVPKAGGRIKAVYEPIIFENIFTQTLSMHFQTFRYLIKNY